MRIAATFPLRSSSYGGRAERPPYPASCRSCNPLKKSSVGKDDDRVDFRAHPSTCSGQAARGYKFSGLGKLTHPGFQPPLRRRGFFRTLEQIFPMIGNDVGRNVFASVIARAGRVQRARRSRSTFCVLCVREPFTSFSISFGNYLSLRFQRG